MPDEATLLERLSAKFDSKTIKKNPRGYHYVAIDAVYNRLDEILGAEWDLTVTDSRVEFLDPDKIKYGNRNPKPGFLATCTVAITVKQEDGAGFKVTVRYGVGADFADDADKAYKTALANAVKKAANGFGVARYLWSEEERAEIDREQEAANDVSALKKAVAGRYLAHHEAKGNKMTVEGFNAATPAQKLGLLAEFYDVPKEDLASAETLRKILERG